MKISSVMIKSGKYYTLNIDEVELIEVIREYGFYFVRVGFKHKNDVLYPMDTISKLVREVE